MSAALESEARRIARKAKDARYQYAVSAARELLERGGHFTLDDVRELAAKKWEHTLTSCSRTLARQVSDDATERERAAEIIRSFFERDEEPPPNSELAAMVRA